MNAAWIRNIANHRDTIRKVRDDLEDRYSLLANESDAYNEAIQAVIDDLEDAITDLDEALKQATSDAGGSH